MADAEELRAAAECKKARELTRPDVQESRRQPVGESGWESWNFDGRVRIKLSADEMQNLKGTYRAGWQANGMRTRRCQAGCVTLAGCAGAVNEPRNMLAGGGAGQRAHRCGKSNSTSLVCGHRARPHVTVVTGCDGTVCLVLRGVFLIFELADMERMASCVCGYLATHDPTQRVPARGRARARLED